MRVSGFQGFELKGCSGFKGFGVFRLSGSKGLGFKALGFKVSRAS